MGGYLIVNLILLDDFSIRKSNKKENGYEVDVKGEYNVKKSKTLKPCTASLQKKSNYNKNQEKSNFHFTDKNYNIDSYSCGDQTDSKSDDWERFSDFVDSELISDSSNDEWIPKVVIITRI